jgi:hypothetical protein
MMLKKYFRLVLILVCFINIFCILAAKSGEKAVDANIKLIMDQKVPMRVNGIRDRQKVLFSLKAYVLHSSRIDSKS